MSNIPTPESNSDAAPKSKWGEVAMAAAKLVFAVLLSAPIMGSHPFVSILCFAIIVGACVNLLVKISDLIP